MRYVLSEQRFSFAKFRKFTDVRMVRGNLGRPKPYKRDCAIKFRDVFEELS